MNTTCECLLQPAHETVAAGPFLRHPSGPLLGPSFVVVLILLWDCHCLFAQSYGTNDAVATPQIAQRCTKFQKFRPSKGAPLSPLYSTPHWSHRALGLIN
jgi:hypothetical protein